MTHLAIIFGGVWGVLSLAVLWVARLRIRRGPQPWGFLDAAFAFYVLMWVSGGLSVLALLFSFDSIEALQQQTENPSPRLAVLLTSMSMMGTCLAALFAWLRAGRARMRLISVGWRWWVCCVLIMLPMSGVFWVSEEFFDLLGVEVEPQMIAVAVQQMAPGLELALMLALIIIGAPIFEEIVFRGFIQPVMVRHLGMWMGIVLTALVFGAIHGSDPHAVGPVTVLGILLGWLRERTDSVTAPIIMHMANNTGAMLIVCFAGV